MITPVAFTNIKNHTYTIFAVINAIMVPCVYFFFPETAYRSLEEMDVIFHKVSGWSAAVDVVDVARREPRRYGKNGELLNTTEAAEDAEKAVVEHSSATNSVSEAAANANNGIFSANDAQAQRTDHKGDQ